MQISAINNYSIQSNQRQQQNPNFGKLIIDKSVPTELIKPIAKNSEIQKMVGMFHDVGADIMAKVENTYRTVPYDRNTIQVGKYIAFIPKTLNTKVHDTVLCINGFQPTNYLRGVDTGAEFIPDGYFLENIEQIKEGTAEKAFNKYQRDTEEAIKLEKESAESRAELKAAIEAYEAAKKAAELQKKTDRENALAEVEALNKSLEPTIAPKAQESIAHINEVEFAEPVEQKKSFWKRLFNL